LKTNWERPEENGSFATCMKMWCAKVPRGNVCPRRCVVLKQGLADEKVAFVWAQRDVDRSSEAERYRISPQRMPLLGHVASAISALLEISQDGRTSISLTPLEGHVSFG
jgi:hypothetical protein